MSRKFSLVIVSALLLVGYVTSFGQTAPANGTVELVKADGSKEPVANALIEVYRTDIKAGFPSAKTNKKGEFAFAGIPFAGTFAFAISAPGCAPRTFLPVKAGQAEKLLISMTPGDGSKLTEDDVRKQASAKPGAGTAGPTGPAASNDPPKQTAEEKKLADEYAKKNAEITEKNKKIQAADEIARKSNEEGNAALKAENWDLALTKFNEGVEAVPDYVGSTPILLNGKVIALKAKGFKVYREGATQPDAQVRIAKYQEANKFYDEALAAFQQAVTVIKGAEASTDPAEGKRREALQTDLYSAATEIHRLKAVSGVDTTKAADADTVITAYIAMETNPDKKFAATMALGDIMRLTGDYPKAVATYKHVLEVKPDHPEALQGSACAFLPRVPRHSLRTRKKNRRVSTTCQKYIEIAPASATDSQTTKEFKQSVKETVDYLKSLKMAPQKLPPAKKKP